MPRPHDRKRFAEQMVAEGRPRYAEDVRAGMARLGGRSRSDLEPDHRRGAASPLGHGMISKKEERSVCRQSISDSLLGNLRECLAHLV
jgi:hypothetical protein